MVAMLGLTHICLWELQLACARAVNIYPKANPFWVLSLNGNCFKTCGKLKMAAVQGGLTLAGTPP